MKTIFKIGSIYCRRRWKKSCTPPPYLCLPKAMPLRCLLSHIFLTASKLVMNDKPAIQFIKFQLSNTIFHSLFKLMRLFTGGKLSITCVR